MTLAFAGIAAYFDSRTEKEYDQTATIQLQTATQEAPLLYLQRRNPDISPEGEAAELGSVILPQALGDASRILSRARTPTPLSGSPIAGPAGPGLSLLGVRHSDPVAGARVANALANAVVKRIREGEIASIDRVIRLQKRELRKLKREARDSFISQLEYSAERVELAELRIRRSTALGARIVTPARPGSQAVSQQRTVPALLLGFQLALLGAFLLDRIDRRPRDPRRLAAAVGVQLAGVIPALSRRHGPGESFGRLRNAIEGLGDRPPRVVLITSAEAAAGKTTVAVGLAEAAADAGLRVCLIEGDLRQPLLAQRLGLDGPGLDGVLQGTVELTDALRTVSAGPADTTFTLLAAGSGVAGRGEPLLSPEFDAVLARLRADHDLVLLESPPPRVGGAGRLAARAEVVLLCARAGRTRVEELEAVARGLRRAQGPAVQLVVSGVSKAALAGSPEPRRVRRLRRRWEASAASLGTGA